MNMRELMNSKRALLITGLAAFWVSLFLIDLAPAQDKPETAPCPTPYIKLIKPSLARPGQEVTIRGRRFGEDGESGDVIFTPGLSAARIIYWRNNRVKAIVPPGAQTGEVVVKTPCATSNGRHLNVEGEIPKVASGGTMKQGMD